MSPVKLTEEQVRDCAFWFLDHPNPDDVDNLHELALKMDMEYDEETGLYIDHEGVQKRIRDFARKNLK